MTRFFLSVYDYFARRRKRLFALLILLVAILLGLAGQIRFREDISRFLPEDRQNKRINDAYQYVASSNTITVYCHQKASAASPATLQVEALDALAERLMRLDTTFINRLFYRADPAEMQAVSSFVIDNMPYFLEEEDYRRMDTLLTREAIEHQTAVNRQTLASFAGMAARSYILADPLQLSGELMRRLQQFAASDRYRLYLDHLFSDDGEALMFIHSAIPASETGRNEALLDSLQSFIAQTEDAFQGIAFEYVGAAEIGLTNARQIRRDTIFSISLAAAIIFAMLIYAFRSGRKILLIFASVLFGGVFALALLYLIRGEVSIIAVGISSIMFGIAINYPLHFLEHHKHVADSRVVIKEIIAPLTIGNITTAGAFISLLFIGSEAMSDLGLFAALLLAGAILFVLFFFPHLLPPDAQKPAGAPKNVFERAIAYPFEKNRRLIFAVLALTVFFGFFSGDSRFETDMRKINYMTSSQQRAFDKMTGLLHDHRHVMYYVTEGGSLEEALQAAERQLPRLQALVDDGKISRIAGVGSFYPSQALQAERLKRWEAFWRTRRERVTADLRRAAQASGFRDDAFSSFEELVTDRREVVSLSHFAPLREALAGNYIVENAGQAMIVTMLYTDRDDAPALEALLNDGHQSGIAFDAGSITRRMIASLSDNFNFVLLVCAVIVFLFLVFSLGRIELSLIAFAPLALSWVLLLGLMNIFDLRFNIVNIILATFIFGQGDDYTIFMTEGLMYEYAYRRKMLSSYKKSIAMSAMIMLAGMGMLLAAKHPALRSLAEVTVVGMTSVVIMAYIIPSWLFGLLTVKGGKKRPMPVTLKNLLATVWAFLFFLLASFCLTAAGWVMFTPGRATERKKMRYHRMLCAVARFVIRRIPQVETTFVNQTGETFDRPGVIISNHQSHLDLMCILMLTPKLIILTNDWVWRSPFYGRLIRYADFYPVSAGMDNVADRLREAVGRGYSIVVFPEGTRSADCSIRRFHSGAFYLAGQLHVDLIPVMIHGAGYVLPKDELMLRRGRIHIRVMPRIAPDDVRFRPDYSPRAKDVCRYYRSEYASLCREIETPDYYADRVIKSYLYKGFAIERNVRRNLQRRHNYVAEIAAAPDAGEITIASSGYGEYALLLALVKKDLQITAVEPDPDRRALAENAASLPDNLKYVESSEK